MKNSRLNFQDEFGSIFKSIDNLPKKSFPSKPNIQLEVNDYYLQFNDPKNKLANFSQISIHKHTYGEKLFAKVSTLVKDGCVSCLIRINDRWIFTSINIVSKDKIEISYIKELKDEPELQKIYYLSNTIMKLKNKLIPKKIVKKYISNYFEYIKAVPVKTNLNSITSVI